MKNALVKKSVIKVGVSLVILAIAFVFVSQLEVKSNMEEMLPKDSPYLTASKEFDLYFEAQEQGVVLINNDVNLEKEVFKTKAITFMEALETDIVNKGIVKSVLYKIDNEALKSYAWAYMPYEDLFNLSETLKSKDQEAIKAVLESFEASYETLEPIEYLVSDDGNHYMMMVKPYLLADDFEATRTAFYDGVMASMNTLLEQETYGGIEAGLTGGAFIQDIEGDRIAFSGIGGTLIMTLGLILLLVIVFFGGLKLPMLSLYPLIWGAVTAAAAGYLIYGSINMFSVSFAMLLLGLGIDFAVHLIARYKEEREQGKDLSEAITIASKSTGLSIVIGAFTTAFAFATFNMAQFRAFAQMGMISAIGIALLCISMLVLVPALIALTDKHYKKPLKIQPSFNFLETGTRKLLSYKWLLVALIVMVGIVLYPSVIKTEVIGDMSAIYPSNLPSINYADQVKEAFDYNSNTVNVYFDSIGSLKEGIEALENKDSINAVHSVLDYLPTDSEDRLELVLESAPYLEAMGIDLISQLTLEVPTYESLPKVVVDNYVGKNGKLLAEIVPSGDVFKEDECRELIEDVKEATGQTPIGMAILMNEITNLVTKDTVVISIMCLSAIFIIAFIAFRHILYALMTLLPVGLGLYITLGLLPILNIQVNLFSVASFPLIIGIGVDSSIHLLHRIKEEETLSIPYITKVTGKAIILTGLTTVIGFGSLSNINHPGMQNFGLVVVVGMIATLLMTLTLIPVGMELIRTIKEKALNQTKKKYKQVRKSA